MRGRVVVCLLAAAVSLVLRPAPAGAQNGLLEDLTMIVDTNVSTITTTTTDASGQVFRTTADTVFPRLTVNADALVTSSLRLNTGGVFDVNLASNNTGERAGDTSLARLRPFFELRSTDPTFTPGFGYYRRENRSRAAGLPGVTQVSEDYAGYLGWKPEGLPRSELQFVRTNLFDGRRAFQDQTRDFGSILSRYEFKALDVLYQGSYTGNTDRRRQLETRQVINGARLDFAKVFLAKRLHTDATYNVNHQDLTTVGAGQGGEVPFPVVPFTGLATISDSPLTAALTQNQLLIDSNLTASAGIDLGVATPGPESQARNVGLDFLTSVEVNRFLLWIDRELPAELASWFSWEIYSSADNITWTRQATVSTAPFGPFENRFQIDFGVITARYVKVVTRPLSATLPESSRFQDIFVTELQPFMVRSAAEARGRLVRTSQVFNADVRLRLLDAAALDYEASYWYTGVSSATHRETLSNGVSLNRRLGRMFGAFGRAAREQGTQPDGRRVANVTNATLTFDPIRTFRSSFLYTGQNERIDDRPNDRQTLLVQTDAQLYRGFDLQFGFGWNFVSAETGEDLRDRLLSLSTTIVPRQNVNFTVNYVDTATTRSGVFTGNPEYRTRRGYVTLAVDPLRTLHLVLGEEVVAVTGDRTRLTHNIGANWTPFPDGSLQFVVAYNEALRDLIFGTERNFVQSVRWTFKRPSYFEVSYQRIEGEYVLDTTETKVLSANVRLFF